jgi:uncharacterized membrane protein HdeD (DUF308 family)
MALLLVNRWWTLLVRGVSAVLFGLLTFVAPGPSLFALVLLFGLYALVDGAFGLADALQRRQAGRPWGSLVVVGLASIVAGVLALLWPGITALALLYLIAAWAAVTGVGQIAAAIRLRKQIRGEWLLALSGAISVALGVLLFLFPAAGALATVIWIGAFVLVHGALLIALSLRVRRLQRGIQRRIPPGGVPTAA